LTQSEGRVPLGLIIGTQGKPPEPFRDLVALVPSRLLHQNNKRPFVRELSFEAPSFEVIAVWHPRNDKDKAHRWGCVVD
jgi:hypothetical protein